MGDAVGWNNVCGSTMKPSINQMTTQDIVRNCDELRNSDANWEKVYVLLYKSVESNKYRIMRCNNTLFWYRLDSKSVAQLFILNADSGRKLIRNLHEFIKAMKKAGFKKIYGVTIEPQMIQTLRNAGYPTEVEHFGKDENGREEYKVTINV
jgi:hypothetical protein